MIASAQAELAALHLLQTGEGLLCAQLEAQDFSDPLLAYLFLHIKQSVDADVEHLMNPLLVEVSLAKTHPQWAGYKWLEMLNHAPYLGAPYQLVEHLRRCRASREAEKFRVAGMPEEYPGQFHDKGREIERLIASPHLSVADMVTRIKQGVTVVPTGFAAIDGLCNGGCEAGGMFVLASRPGIGKTTLAINIMKNLLVLGKTVYFGSLEMPQERILQRLLQNYWQEDAASVQLHIEEMQRLGGDVIIDNPGYDISRILSAMTAHVDADVFMLDYYQLIQMAGKESQIQKLELISNKLKEFAYEHKKPLFVIAQLNRQIENDRRNREPELADLRGCGALEQDATTVSFLWDKAAKEGDAAQDILHGAKKAWERDLKWIIRKNRNGQNGIVDVEFDPRTMTFAESSLHG